MVVKSPDCVVISGHKSCFPKHLEKESPAGFNPFPNNKFRLFQTQRVCRRQFQI